MSKSLRTIVFVAILVASVALAITGFIILPDTIVTQFGSGGSRTTMPKAIGLLIPLALAVVFDVLFLLGANTRRDLVISVVGLLVMVVTLVVNI